MPAHKKKGAKPRKQNRGAEISSLAKSAPGARAAQVRQNKKKRPMAKPMKRTSPAATGKPKKKSAARGLWKRRMR